MDGTEVKFKEKRYNQLYMDLAERVSHMSYARRLQVGVVIVKDDNIISFGWNGMPAGWDNNCEDTEYVGSDEQIPSPDEMKRLGFTGTDHGWYRLKTKPEVLHAEQNALAKLAKSNISSQDSTMFLTHAPCIDCAKQIFTAGIKKVYFGQAYRSDQGVVFLQQCGVEVNEYPK